jgi:hypothetical protein
MGLLVAGGRPRGLAGERDAEGGNGVDHGDAGERGEGGLALRERRADEQGLGLVDVDLLTRGLAEGGERCEEGGLGLCRQAQEDIAVISEVGANKTLPSGNDA